MANARILKNRFLTTAVATVLLAALVLIVPSINELADTQAHAKSIVPDNLDDLEFQPLKPTKAQIRTSVNVLDQLSYQHYREMKIDDQLSSLMLDSYISDLDPSKIYFLASDVAEFEQYRKLLDDALKSGNLKPGFAIYNRFLTRLIERLTYVITYIETDFDKINFKVDESIETDRENAEWPKNLAEVNELWRKRMKGAALSLLLAEKPQAEIKELLMKRYRSRLNRALRTKSSDAFQTYINSLTQVFDPHTQYFSPRSSENFNINMSLSLEGIGAVLQTEDEYTKVVRLVPAGPAEKSGLLHPADKIVSVAQGKEGLVDVVGWRIDEVVELIRGPKGTEVRLEIISSKSESQHDTKIISIIRDRVKLEEQAAKQELIEIPRKDRTYRIGAIDIPAFYLDFKAQNEREPDYRSTTRDVTKLIRELQQVKAEGLIIDLRDNGGGSLQEANTLLGLFINKGPTVQVKDDRGRIELIEDNNPSTLYRGPIVVLVNRLSASASEIFAGAIQDYHRGLVLGSQTFGKGTVQALRRLNRGQLKITQAKFYRISGESNQHQGIIPDIVFPSVYDETEIGESTLDNALPWDKIRSVRYRRYQSMQRYVPTLVRQHHQRVEHDPDFQHLISTISLSRELKDQTLLSLNQETRINERKDRESRRLELENKRRLAKGLKPLTELEDEEDENSTVKKDDDKDEPDPLLTEAANILADILLLSENPGSQAYKEVLTNY